MAAPKGTGGNPSGVDRTTRKYNRNLAIAVRDGVPAEIMVEFHMAVLMGKNPTLEKDGRLALGYRVTWSEAGGVAPSLIEKMASIKFLSERGWGMPAQSIHLEAEVRAQMAQINATLDAETLKAMPPAVRRQMVELLTQALAPKASAPKELDVIDVTPKELVAPVDELETDE